MSQTRQLVTSSGHARLAVFAPERESLPLEEALDLLLRHAPTVTASEEVPLFDADGRICFAHVRADLPQPPYDRVQVDGYALRSAAIADATPLYSLTALRELYLPDSVLTVEQLDALRAALPKCAIYT